MFKGPIDIADVRKHFKVLTKIKECRDLMLAAGYQSMKNPDKDKRPWNQIRDLVTYAEDHYKKMMTKFVEENDPETVASLMDGQNMENFND